MSRRTGELEGVVVGRHEALMVLHDEHVREALLRLPHPTTRQSALTLPFMSHAPKSNVYMKAWLLSTRMTHSARWRHPSG